MPLDNFEDFLRDGESSRWSVFDSHSMRFLVAMKVPFDDRFSVILGNGVYKEPNMADLNENELLLVALGRQSEPAKRLGIYDAKFDTVYDAAYDLRPYIDVDECPRLSTVLDQMKEAVSHQVSLHMNNPDFKDGLVEEARTSGYEGYSIDNYSDKTEELYIQGASLDEVRNKDVDWHVDIGSIPDARPEILLAISYLTNSNDTVRQLSQSVENDPDLRVKMGAALIDRDSLAEAYAKKLEDANNNPDLKARLAIHDALHGFFGDEKAGNLWITAAKNGRSVKFQYPMDRLMSIRAGDTIYDGNIPSLAQRKAVIKAFGFPYHTSTSRTFDYSDSNIGLADIADISYRGKTIYSIPMDELNFRLATKEVEIALYRAQDNLREIMLEPESYLRAGRALLEDGLKNAKEDDFEFSLNCKAQICANGSEEAAFAQAYQELSKEIANNGQPSYLNREIMRVGDGISIDGKTMLIDRYTGFHEAPFSLPAQGKASHTRNEIEKDAPVSLGSEVRDMRGASGELGRVAQDRSVDHNRSDGER